MKAHKIITITTIILAIIIISIASFGGIYKLKEYKVVNVVPDYLLGMKFNNSRVANFTVSNEIAETKIYDKDGKQNRSRRHHNAQFRYHYRPTHQSAFHPSH